MELKRRLIAGWMSALLALAATSQAVATPARDAEGQPTEEDRRPLQPGALAAALTAARQGDVEEARRRQAELPDVTERKLVDWALTDAAPARLPMAELAALVEPLATWPRAARREAMLRPGETGPRPSVDLANPRDIATDYRNRRLRMSRALQRGASRAAYDALRGHIQPAGTVGYAELESFAGWLALNKLGDPAAAERHFTRLDAAVRSPVSRSRAAYWRGRTAERAGDPIAAQLFYARGARHLTTFYGQLAAEKAGYADMVLPPDPIPTLADRQAFAAAEMTRAIESLAGAGQRDLVRVFALHQGGRVESAVELALLVDLLRELGETEVALLAYRRGARLGYVLPERGYPVISPPNAPGGAEPALVLAVTRQESQFDPRVRSPAGARGMMQILPSTGRLVARQVGLPWKDGVLWDARANMRLGSRYLGDLADRFSGSYVLAAAGYNAGPGRPAQWVNVCGDPRSPHVDPLDFIECIPFGETRDYVMNVLSNYNVYRARLNGGRAPLRASENLASPGRTNPGPPGARPADGAG